MIKQLLSEQSDLILQHVTDHVDGMVTIFDTDLNYLLVNKKTCALLKKQKHELEGKNMLELYPSLTASNAHRYLLEAISGSSVIDAITEGTFTGEGAQYSSCFHPLKKDGKVYAILVLTKTLYTPHV